jgi:intraflagellar transport protein 56
VLPARPASFNPLTPSLLFSFPPRSYSAKAFDVLERLDPDPEYWEGKRGAFAGVFQAVVAGKAPKEDLRDVLAMVRHGGNPQVEYMTRVVRKWAKDANVKIT